MDHDREQLDALLSTQTEQLTWEFRKSLTDREVLHAVARARIDVRERFRVTKLEVPAAEEFVALIIGMARRRLTERYLATETAPARALAVPA